MEVTLICTIGVIPYSMYEWRLLVYIYSIVRVSNLDFPRCQIKDNREDRRTGGQEDRRIGG